MNSYDYNSLKAAAEDAGVWIDVRDNKVLRGQGKGNTNKKERVSRSLSWYAKSESAATPDERLIFSYIAFNALYAQEEQMKEYKAHENFLFQLIARGGGNEIFAFALEQKKALRKIMSSQYLSKIYWDDKGGMSEKGERLEREKKIVDRIVPQIKSRNIAPVKDAIYRIYLLRNQLLHGMAAYQDSYNRHQVQLCADFLHPLVGRMIATVIGDKKQNWGKVPYPPQGYPNESCIEVKELED